MHGRPPLNFEIPEAKDVPIDSETIDPDQTNSQASGLGKIATENALADNPTE